MSQSVQRGGGIHADNKCLAPFAMTGYQYPQWQYNPQLPSDSSSLSFPSSLQVQRSAANSENYSLNMQNFPFSLPGLGLASSTAAQEEPARGSDSDDDMEFYGTPSNQPDIPTRTTCSQNTNGYPYFDGATESGQGTSNDEDHRHGQADGTNSYTTNTAESQPALELPGLGSFGQAVDSAHARGAQDPPQVTVTNSPPEELVVQHPNGHQPQQLAPDQLIAQLLAAPQGKSAPSYTMDAASRSGATTSVVAEARRSSDTAPASTDATTSFGPHQFAVLHRLALATVKSLHQSGMAFDTIASLGPLNDSERVQLVQLYRELGLLPDTVGPLTNVPPQQHNGLAPTQKLEQISSQKIERTADPVPQSTTQPTVAPQMIQAITTPQPPPTTTAAQSKSAAPALSESAPRPLGRQAYLARLEAAKLGKKTLATKDAQHTSIPVETGQGATEARPSQALNGINGIEKVAVSQSPPPAMSATQGKPQTQAPSQSSRVLPAQFVNTTTASGSTIPPETEKTKSTPANERILARMAELRRQYDANKREQLAAAVSAAPPSPAPATRQSSATSFGSVYSVEQHAHGARNNFQNELSPSHGSPPSAVAAPAHGSGIPGVMGPAMSSQQSAVERPDPPGRSFSTGSGPISAVGSYPLYVRQIPPSNFSQPYLSYNSNATPTQQYEESVFDLYVSDKESADEMDIDNEGNEGAAGTARGNAAGLVMPAPQHPAHPNLALLADSTRSPNSTSAPISASQTPFAGRTPNSMQASKDRLAQRRAMLAEKIAAEKKALAELQANRKAMQEASATPIQPSVGTDQAVQSATEPTSLTIPIEHPDRPAMSETTGTSPTVGPQPSFAKVSESEQPVFANKVQAPLQNLSESSTIVSAKRPLDENDTTDLATYASTTADTPFPTYLEPSTNTRSTVNVALDGSRTQTPESDKKRLAGSPENITDRSRKKRLAETESHLYETTNIISKKMRLMEEHKQMMVQLEAEIQAENQKREELARELEGLGVDTEGMTHEELVKTKETLDAVAQDAAQLETIEQHIQSGIDPVASLSPFEPEPEPQSTIQPKLPASVHLLGGQASSDSLQIVQQDVTSHTDACVIANDHKRGEAREESSEGEMPESVHSRLPAASPEARQESVTAASAAAEGEKHSARPARPISESLPLGDSTTDDADMEEGEIDESAADVVAAANEDAPTGEDQDQSMTDDSMSVSSAELPGPSELPTDAAGTPSSGQPVPSYPPSMPAGVADDLAPELQGREPVGRSPIPLAPTRFYDPRDRRVLGLTDERAKVDNGKPKADTDIVSEVTKELHHFEAYDSPLKEFRDYRYHREYKTSASQGFQSVTWSNGLDANMPLCPFELQGGVCNDSTCGYQHFRDLALKPAHLLLQLGGKIPSTTAEETQKFKDGLGQLISSMRSRSENDVEKISEAIVEYRRNFLHDDTKVLNNL